MAGQVGMGPFVLEKPQTAGIKAIMRERNIYFYWDSIRFPSDLDKGIHELRYMHCARSHANLNGATMLETIRKRRRGFLPAM